VKGGFRHASGKTANGLLLITPCRSAQQTAGLTPINTLKAQLSFYVLPTLKFKSSVISSHIVLI